LGRVRGFKFFDTRSDKYHLQYATDLPFSETLKSILSEVQKLLADFKEAIYEGVQWPPGPIEQVIFYQHLQQTGGDNRFGLIFAPLLNEALILVISGGLRMVFAAAFFVLFLLQILIRGPLLLVWARLVEQEKPVFTVVFGAIAAVGATVKSVVS
jgi:hypothetical protein